MQRIELKKSRAIIVTCRLREVLNHFGIERPTNEVITNWGLTPSAFNQCLKGRKTPTLEQAAAIAADLNIKIDELVKIESVTTPVIDESRLLTKYGHA